MCSRLLILIRWLSYGGKVFGKGILSRSEPTWHARTVTRLNIVNDRKQNSIAMEDITKVEGLKELSLKDRDKGCRIYN